MRGNENNHDVQPGVHLGAPDITTLFYEASAGRQVQPNATGRLRELAGPANQAGLKPSRAAVHPAMAAAAN